MTNPLLPPRGSKARKELMKKIKSDPQGYMKWRLGHFTTEDTDRLLAALSRTDGLEEGYDGQ